MTKFSRGAPLALAVALVSLALHASGCTSLLGELPAGEVSDASVSDGSGSGGDTGNPDTSPGPDVTTDSPTDASTDEGGGGMDARGEGGPTCGPSNCTSGCCNTAGQCVTFSGQSASTCGVGGVACSACATGESCSNGACTCGGSMCNGCCGSGNTCVSPASNAQCGANGAACTACAADQECDAQGQCVCDAHTCPNGCCDSNQHCVTSTSNSQCGTGGASCQTCAQGQECSAGACVCDASSCPMGCCNGGPSGTCEAYTAQSNNSCGTAGSTCGACAMGQSCSNGACTCGGGACAGCCSNGTCTTPSSTACGINGTACMACSSDQTCSLSGQCICDPTTCAGCCDPTTQHCINPTNNNQCGSGGSQCKACGSGLECSNGVCACDATSCSMGCCNGGTNGTCEPFGSQSGMSCGKSGATCGACPTGQTCDGSGNCVCNASSCPMGCCNGGPTGTCEPFGSQSATSCGNNGSTCAACANGLCDTTNGTCSCDPNSCPGGCCDTNGKCLSPTSQSLSSCGTNGVACAACSGADSCTNGSCECGGNPACASPKSCCVSSGVGSCIDLSSDPANCGWCGHSCGTGGTCGGGLCAPVTLGQTAYSSIISRAGGITVAGGNVYFSEYVASANNGYIESCSTAGCPGSPATATVVFTDGGNAGLGQIAYSANQNALYWGDFNQGRYYGYSLMTNSLLFQGSDGVVVGVATDVSYLYLADFEGLAFAFNSTGGGFAHISSTLGYTQGVAVDSNDNIWVAARNNNIVAQCTLGGCPNQWTWTGGPDFIAVAGGTPYVATQSTGVYRCASLTDCSQANATQLSSQSLSNFSNDGNYAYFGSGGAVQRCSLSAGCMSGPQTIASASGNVVWTDVDSTWVYWLTDKGTIQKVAK